MEKQKEKEKENEEENENEKGKEKEDDQEQEQDKDKDKLKEDPFEIKVPTVSQIREKQKEKRNKKQKKIQDFNKVPQLLKIYNRNIKNTFDIINLKIQSEQTLLSMNKQTASGQPLDQNENVREELNDFIKRQHMEKSLEIIIRIKNLEMEYNNMLYNNINNNIEKELEDIENVSPIALEKLYAKNLAEKEISLKTI